MANKLQNVIETDLYQVWMAQQALEVIRARARTWLSKPHVSRNDVLSLNIELRLLRHGLGVGHDHELYVNGDVNNVWDQFRTWCTKPNVMCGEAEWVLDELEKAEERLSRTRTHLEKILNNRG